MSFSKDDPTTITSYEIYFSLYQQLAGNAENDDNEENEDVIEKFKRLFKKDFFDLIIVDECHRGSLVNISLLITVLLFLRHKKKKKQRRKIKRKYFSFHYDYFISYTISFGIPVHNPPSSL